MRKIILPATLIFFILSGVWYLSDTPETMEILQGEEEELRPGFLTDRYEWLLTRNPITGKVPAGIRKRELAWVRTQPERRQSGIMGDLANNTYEAVGPSVNGGRVRAIELDVRYNGGSNKVVLSGGVNGGIFRSTDGGVTWAFVHPANEVRSVTCLAQDPRPGFQDTWYAGTGEANQTAEYPNAFVFGFGILKSVDNGLTWTKLASTATGSEFSFDSFFDLNTRIQVHPVTGDVYVACQEAILRSQNGGTNWAILLRGTQPTNAFGGFTDVLINKAGTKLYAALSGRNPDRAIAGVWTSATGDPGSWTRIAGGVQNQPDSVPGWKPYSSSLSPFPPTAGWGRIVLGFTASEDLLVLVTNSQSTDDGLPEADLFRANTAASPITWSTNLGPNLVASYTGDDTEDKFFKTYVDGYNMVVAGHPTQNNTIFVGGIYLYRSTDGFTTRNNNLLMGGSDFNDPSTTYNDPEGVSHVDYHSIKFDPSNTNRMLTGSDGGVVITQNCLATTPAWSNGNKNLQTFQYYFIGIDQTAGSRNYIGGAQDNGTSIRDRSGFSTLVFGPVLPDSNDHYIFPFGDGAQAYITVVGGNYFIYASSYNHFAYRISTVDPIALDVITPQLVSTQEETGPTYYHIDDDNPTYLYFPSGDTLFRTVNAATVTSTGYTQLEGVDQGVSGDIFSMATTRGPYNPSHLLFIGTTNGKVYRLPDPANTASTTPVVDITPLGMSSGSVVKDISVNPRNHDTVLAVVSNYGVNSIFWTGNATAAIPDWQVIEGNVSLPSVRACEIVVKTTGVEYYVGTSVGLFSTTTISGNSTSWARETGGPGGMMNTNIINSLAYRWVDNRLLVGTHGNGMFVANIGSAINLPTGINDPIRDNKNFIVKAFPTITNGVINYQAGNLLTVKSIQVQVVNLAGQLLYNKTAAYGSGNINISTLPRGMYILTITSNDRKYQFIRKFNKM